MKRFVIITVGKTHSGKTTFARELEKEADYLFVIRNSKDINFTIEKIIHLAKDLSPTPK